MEHTEYTVKYHYDHNHVRKPVDFEGISLYQVGRMYCGSGTEIRTHTHADWFELTAVTDGEGEVFTDGVGVPVHPGDIYLSFPHETHGIRSSRTNPLKFDFFSFGTQLSPYNEALDRVMSAFSPANKRIFQDRRVNQAIEEINAECRAYGLLCPELIAALLRQAVVLILRNFLGEAEKPKDEIPKNSAEGLCYQMMYYIDTHIYTMKSLTELSALTGYNYSYLSSLFKDVTSQTLFAYYHGKRMETAKILLTEEHLPAVRVSELLGYSSPCAFNKAFRACFGVPPSAFRRKKEH